MSMSRKVRGLWAVGVALTVTACATGGTTSDPFTGESLGLGGPVRVTIRNDDFRDATVYGYWNGVRERIGMVTGKTSETFETDWKSETLSFYVNFVGGGEYHSETIEVWGGDHLDFVIMPGW